ncbi:MAG TPA: hypothetical protein VNW99_08670 [Cytophagaceae bacterium]|jgi:hypothetical protein|nr:hypothetical protein [Cytophagaceae bacterium]
MKIRYSIAAGLFAMSVGATTFAQDNNNVNNDNPSSRSNMDQNGDYSDMQRQNPDTGRSNGNKYDGTYQYNNKVNADNSDQNGISASARNRMQRSRISGGSPDDSKFLGDSSKKSGSYSNKNTKSSTEKTGTMKNKNIVQKPGMKKNTGNKSMQKTGTSDKNKSMNQSDKDMNNSSSQPKKNSIEPSY